MQMIADKVMRFAVNFVGVIGSREAPVSKLINAAAVATSMPDRKSWSDL